MSYHLLVVYRVIWLKIELIWGIIANKRVIILSHWITYLNVIFWTNFNCHRNWKQLYLREDLNGYFGWRGNLKEKEAPKKVPFFIWFSLSSSQVIRITDVLVSQSRSLHQLCDVKILIWLKTKAVIALLLLSRNSSKLMNTPVVRRYLSNLSS